MRFLSSKFVPSNNPFMFRKTLSITVFIIVAFAAYLLFNALTFKSKQVNWAPVSKIEIADSAVMHLAQAIRIPTISYENATDFDSAQFFAFGEFIEATYPLVHKQLQKTVINAFSLLYKWQGSNDALAPAVLTAHMDVVPVPEEDLGKWTVPPFSGEIRDGILWGRGAIDDKVSVIGLLEAVELLLHHDHTPERTIYLAFGHDEEIGGLYGARAIAEKLKSDGVAPEFVMDEGYSITQGLVPGVLTDVALIGISEKGFASLTLKIEMEGGHSSMPNNETAIEVMAGAITKLEMHPFTSEICEPVRQFIEHVGPEMRMQEKLAFANRNLFESVILGIYQKSGPGRAVVQTTMAPTIFRSGVKDNVIPGLAAATINFRILPGTSIEDVIHHVRNVVDDPRIQIQLHNFHSEPSRVSSTTSQGYGIINQSIKQIYPEAITAPNLVIAATDGRYYGDICDNVYRFLPILLTQDNINTMHGVDERIPTEEFKDAIRFYVQLLRNCG
jgi:carboxypeptidase PM20D1